MREDGTVLKQLKVADCLHGPHEIRGCIRNDLVKALGDALPEGTIRFGTGVDTIKITEQGARWGHTVSLHACMLENQRPAACCRC